MLSKIDRELDVAESAIFDAQSMLGKLDNKIDQVIGALDDAMNSINNAQYLLIKHYDNAEGYRQIVLEAIADIRAGRTDDAILRLEREFLPKWSSAEQCRADYKAAMKRSA